MVRNTAQRVSGKIMCKHEDKARWRRFIRAITLEQGSEEGAVAKKVGDAAFLGAGHVGPDVIESVFFTGGLIQALPSVSKFRGCSFQRSEDINLPEALK